MVPATRVHDPCLIALFKQLPPADQMTARKVCRRWADLVTYAARSTRSLTILVGDFYNSLDKFEPYTNRHSLGTFKVASLLQKEDGSLMFPLERFNKWNTLQYRGGLHEATVEEIGATFVNIKTLQLGLYHVRPFQYDSIYRLLELWTRELITLKLYEHLDHPEDRFGRGLFDAINGLFKLENLHLDLNSLPYHDLPVISKLNHLSIYWANAPEFATLLRQHASASLRNIEYISTGSAVEHLTSLSDHLLGCFSRIGIPGAPHTNSELISTHFPNLTSLCISTSTDTILRHLFGHLSQLTKLLYLHLIVDFSLLLPDDQPQLLLPQLKSVKALYLRLIIRSHLDLEQLKIGWTMPNIEAIDCRHIRRSKCTDCTIEEFSPANIQANPAVFKHCFRQMLAPLKDKCTQLRTILHNREAILGSADELLAQ